MGRIKNWCRKMQDLRSLIDPDPYLINLTLTFGNPRPLNRSNEFQMIESLLDQYSMTSHLSIDLPLA